MRGVLVLGGVLLALPVSAYDAVPAQSFAKPVPGGKFVLVMLQPSDFPRDKELRKKYARSGLYPVGDPAKPVWTCDWVAQWERNVFASEDGVFAVRVPDLDPGLRSWVLSYKETIPAKTLGWEDDPALWIYQNGKPFRTLALRDVFDASRFTDRDCYLGPIIIIDSFDDASGRVTISTEAGGKKRTATVAFRTGEVVERGGGGFFDGAEGEGGQSWGRVILIGLLVVGVCAAVFVGVAVFLMRWQRMRAG
jgi:hypothetical protein